MNPQPVKECDLVMKGGITSGLVYPPAVVELYRGGYHFRRIGGASAGALAAAAAAAAEHGRGVGGFDKLERLSEWLGRDTHLRDLFQAPPETRPLLALVFDLVPAEAHARPWATVGTLFRSLVGRPVRTALFRSVPARAALALLLVVFLVLHASLLSTSAPLFSAAWFVRAVLVGVAAGLAVTAMMVVQVVRLVRAALRLAGDRANLFGLCSGLTQPGYAPGVQGLTDWLCDTLDDLAGLAPNGAPLTFGDLKARNVELALMATDLCHQRAFQFPPCEDLFLFDEREMRLLFPERVVRWLVANGRRGNGVIFPRGSPYYFLPEKKDLPVVVAARISLSFPVLFGAVPLYTVKLEYCQRLAQDPTAALGGDDVQRTLFSDGGIVSNFPIHLFDDWLPERPVFGINLSDLPADAFPPGEGKRIRGRYQSVSGPTLAEAAGPSAASPDTDTSLTVYLPPAGAAVPLDWRPVNGLLEYLRAIFYTAKNHRDTLQAVMPSYRERVVTIRFAASEGGMNLTMDEKTIEGLQRKGATAGRLLANNFSWKDHRWVRFQVVLAHLEQELTEVLDRYGQEPLYRDWLAEAKNRVGLPFERSNRWCRTALERLDWLNQLVAVSWVRGARAAGPGNDPLSTLINLMLDRRRAQRRRIPAEPLQRHFADGRLPIPPLVKRLTPKE